MIWDDARIFLAIARSGTLSGAAHTLDMGVATVSRRLERLEAGLGMPLFSRHQQGYRLTSGGDALLAQGWPCCPIFSRVRPLFHAYPLRWIWINRFGWPCKPSWRIHAECEP